MKTGQLPRAVSVYLSSFLLLTLQSCFLTLKTIVTFVGFTEAKKYDHDQQRKCKRGVVRLRQDDSSSSDNGEFVGVKEEDDKFMNRCLV